MAGLAVAGFAPAATWAVVGAPNATLWPSFQPEIFAASGVATISLSLAGLAMLPSTGVTPVLGEVLAPHAAKAGHVVVGDGGGERLAVGPERDDEKIRSARYGCDLGKPGKPVGNARAAEAAQARDVVGLHPEVRGMGGGQVGREGGLGAPGAGYGAHGESAYETQQEHDSEIPGPSPVHGRPEPVPGHPHCPVHLLAPPVPRRIPTPRAHGVFCDYGSATSANRGRQLVSVASC